MRQNIIPLPKLKARPSYRLYTLIAFLSFLFIVSSTSTVEASHYRYGQITWTPDPAVPGKIDFTVNTAWRGGSAAIGSTQSRIGRFYFGNGSSTFSTQGVVVSNNAAENWFFMTSTFSYTYTSSGNFTAYFGSCCRIGGMQNGSNANYRGETIVNIDLANWASNNKPPNSSLPAIVAIQQGTGVANFIVPGFDPDGDNLTFRLANSSEIGISNPSGLSIDSNTGLISFTPPSGGFTFNHLYAAGVTIEDGKSKTIVDFIIKVVGTSMPPTFDYSSTPANNFAYTLSPGDNINFTVDADDPDSGSTVFLLATGQPSSGTFTPALPTSPSSGNSSTTFDWSPGISDLGSYVITFTATDNLGVQSLTSVVINVTSAPVLDSPPSLGDQSLLCLETGAYSQTLQFSDADVNDAVSIVSANFLSTLPATIPTPPSTPGGGFPVVGSLPPGLSFSTALPTTAANPTSTDLSGFISASDWGIYNLEITAEDGFGEQTSLNNYYIVNEDPYFTTPVPAGETAYVGQSYTLVISASDNDIAYGDAVAFADPGKSYVMIPSWMTATADGNGNLTLSGTPSATDAGTHSLQIELHDRTTHFQHFHCSWQFQNFDIEVLTCNSPVAACNDITVSFDGNSSVQITAADIDAGSTADCGVAELTASPTEFFCADYIGENVTVSNANVTLTMEDINGEISSCISVVSVVHDDDSPVYDECPSDVTVDNDMALCGAIQNYNVTASDACSNVTLIQTEGLTSGSLFPVGVTTNTFEASDEDNNVSVCSFTVTVLDNEAPIALCQDITVELGALGAGTVSDSEISGVINTYASVTGLGTDNVTVTSAGGFGNGDKVIVMQMNGADINQSNSASFGDVTAINNAGNYEYARIKSVSGNTIEFLTDLERAYDVSATIQLIRVPEYDNVLVTGTLTAADWNGSTGGVLAFDAEGTVTMNAGIDMDGKGYRGGLRSNNYFPGCPNITNYFLSSPTGQSGDKGEGIADLGSAYKAGRGRLVNGGGGATSINSGGGGGANIGAGGHGGREWIGCNQPLGGLGGASVAAYNSSNKVFLGGAGGGGQQNNSAGTNGADGGGMVFITAEEIIGNGNTISANGNNALHANNDGAGGGGAGGSVLINATSLSSGLTVSVAGGYGGNALFDHGPAGGGGGGLFWHSGASLPESISVNTSGGARGLAGGNNRGSADGLAGGTLGGLEFPGVTSISAATILITDIDAGSTDNCDIASIELTQTEYDCGDLGEVVVTMTVDDINANSSSCNATVTVVEYNVPDLTCPASIMVDNDLGQCSAIVQFAATASDDCDDSVALTYSSNSGDSYPLGESTISVTATDDSENESTCTFTIVVSDNEDPAITCPSDINVFATSAAGTVVTYLTPVGTDNCSSTTTLDLGFASGDVFPLGTTSNIYTAEDATGNSVSCGFDVTVTGIAPDVICPDDLLVSTDNGSCDAVVTYSASESTAIPAAIITYSITPGSVFQLGSTEVTATATNAIGNDACTFTVTVEDKEAPQINCPDDVTVSCDDDVTPLEGCNVADAVYDSVVDAPVDFTFTPIVGNQITPTYTISTPVIATPILDVTFYQPVNYYAVAYEPLTQVTLCDITCYNHSGSVVGTATLELDPVQSEVIGISSSEPVSAITFTTIDATPVTFTEMASVACTVGYPATEDNCSSSVIYSDSSTQDADGISDNADDYNYVITRTWTASDPEGNITPCSHIITVEDTTAPELTCPADLSTATDVGVCGATVDIGELMTSDDCSSVVVMNDAPLLFSLGATTVTWTGTDASGNDTECTQSVTVTDNEAPLALCQAHTVQLDADGLGGLVPADIDGGSEDACGIQSLVASQTDFDCSHVGGNTVTLTVTDNNGNVSICESTVTVEDNVAPVATCQVYTVQLNSAGAGSIVAADIDGGSSDACGVTLAASQTDFDCSHVGGNTVALTVTDINGNVSTCESTVTVVDNVNPMAVCLDVTVTADSSGDGYIVAADVDGGSSDACGITLAVSQEIFSCITGMYEVTLTVTDASGNVDACNATVTLDGDDSDCDTYLDACDQCNGGDDTVDNNSDGLPDCAYPPAFNDIIDAWKCGNNLNKVLVCHLPPGNPSNAQTICISRNAVPTHVPNHGGDYLGECFHANCNNSGSITNTGDDTALSSEYDYIDLDHTHVHDNTHDHDHNHSVEGELEALVFPNPTTHELFVTLKASSDTNYSVNVFNNIGQLVIQKKYDNDGIKRMDVSAWETGSYVLRIVSGPKTITKNIVIVD